MTDSLPIPLTSPLSNAQTTSIVNLVRRAAKTEILPRFRNLSSEAVTAKANRFDLVTDADNAAEAMLTRGIQRMFPHALVVGEEAASANSDLRGKIAEAELAFIIDPVDGTWNFSNGLAVFGVILSVTRFGKPVFGMLYDPIADDWIIAEETGAAELIRPLGAPRKVSVASGKELHELAGFMHFYLLSKKQQTEMATRLPAFVKVQALQCSCHEYRTLSQGGVDFLLSGTLNPWDHAAGVLICQRAGGVVRMLDGQDYNAGIETGFVLAATDEQTWAVLRDTFAFLLPSEDAPVPE